MKKGFIFSMDALGAIAIVIVLGAVWILFLHHSSGMWPGQVAQEAKDRAMVALYKNQPNLQTPGDTANQDMNTVFCKKYFTYAIASNQATANSICWGVK